MGIESVKNTGKNNERKGRPENLRPPWKKGESGNPNGRPTKDRCITSLMKEILEQVSPTDSKGRTYKELVALATVQGAIKGKTECLKELLNRTEGRVPQPVTGADGYPLFPESPRQVERKLAIEKRIKTYLEAHPEAREHLDSVVKLLKECESIP